MSPGKLECSSCAARQTVLLKPLMPPAEQGSSANTNNLLPRSGAWQPTSRKRIDSRGEMGQRLALQTFCELIDAIIGVRTCTPIGQNGKPICVVDQTSTGAIV